MRKIFLSLLFAIVASVASAQGTDNTKLGPSACWQLSATSKWNVCVGAAAGAASLGTVGNIYIGYGAGYKNVSANHITAVGLNALYWNTAPHNTGVGRDALFSNTTGPWNTGIGVDACPGNEAGTGNTCIGGESGYGEDDPNTPQFEPSLNQNKNGNFNTFVGYQSSAKSGQQDAVNSTALGYRAKIDKSNQVSIGNANVTEFVFGGVTLTKAQLQALIALLPPQ